MRMSAGLLHETMGMHFTEITVSERSQTQRKTSRVMPFVKWGFSALALVTFGTR